MAARMQAAAANLLNLSIFLSLVAKLLINYNFFHLCTYPYNVYLLFVLNRVSNVRYRINQINVNRGN